MTARPVKILDRGTTFVVKGFEAAARCRAAGLKPIWNGVADGYVMDAHRLPDLLAHLDHEGIPARLHNTQETRL